MGGIVSALESNQGGQKSGVEGREVIHKVGEQLSQKCHPCQGYRRRRAATDVPGMKKVMNELNKMFDTRSYIEKEGFCFSFLPLSFDNPI